MRGDGAGAPIPDVAGARLAGIDGLRAIAMTMVIAQHSGLLPFGWTGVWLFYVISGFVITYGFLSTTSGDTAAQIIRFAERRLFRIVPVYFLYLAATFLVAALTGGAIGWGSIGSLLTFTFNWHMLLDVGSTNIYTAATEHLWTLSVEQQFYLVFPILFFALPRRYFLIVASALIIGGPLVRLLYAYALDLGSADPKIAAFAVYAASICHFDAFLTGALIAHYSKRLQSAQRVSLWLLLFATIAFAAYVSIYFAVNYAQGARGLDVLRNVVSGVLYGQGRELVGYSVVNLVAAAVIVATLSRIRFTEWLSHPALALIGRISYGGYLFHALVLSVLSPALLSGHGGIASRILLFLIAWSVTVGIAYISFRYFEAPVMQRAKQWTRSRRGGVSSAQTSRSKTLPAQARQSGHT